MTKAELKTIKERLKFAKAQLPKVGTPAHIDWKDYVQEFSSELINDCEKLIEYATTKRD